VLDCKPSRLVALTYLHDCVRTCIPNTAVSSASGSQPVLCLSLLPLQLQPMWPQTFRVDLGGVQARTLTVRQASSSKALSLAQVRRSADEPPVGHRATQQRKAHNQAS
jgi:hypothetical protein